MPFYVFRVLVPSRATELLKEFPDAQRTQAEAYELEVERETAPNADYLIALASGRTEDEARRAVQEQLASS